MFAHLHEKRIKIFSQNQRIIYYFQIISIDTIY